MNGKIRLVDDGTLLLRERDMLQYFSVLLVLHTTGFTMEKSIDALNHFGAVLHSLQRMRWLSASLLVFPITERGT